MHLRERDREFREWYPVWLSVQLWARDLRMTLDEMYPALSNPFASDSIPFERAAAVVRKVGEEFGSFQNLECQTLKSVLVEAEHQGTGRVPISAFYKIGLGTAWKFWESKEYLRARGALDETDPASPSVIIPNYVQSEANSLRASDFYSVYCFNECEGLFAKLEMRLATREKLVGHAPER